MKHFWRSLSSVAQRQFHCHFLLITVLLIGCSESTSRNSSIDNQDPLQQFMDAIAENGMQEACQFINDLCQVLEGKACDIYQKHCNGVGSENETTPPDSSGNDDSQNNPPLDQPSPAPNTAPKDDSNPSAAPCFEPQFHSVTLNEWWREFSCNMPLASLQLQIQNGATYDMSYQWNKWIHGDSVRIPAGTQVRLLAKGPAGESGQTNWFALQNENPQTVSCSAPQETTPPPNNEAAPPETPPQSNKPDPSNNSNPSNDPPLTNNNILNQLLGKTMYSSNPIGCAKWLGPWFGGNQNMTNEIVKEMQNAGDNKFPVFTTYWSLDLNADESGFLAWIEVVAKAIGSQKNFAVLVLEADAFAGSPNTHSILDKGIGIIKQFSSNTAVFLDIGHNAWLSAEVVATNAKKFNNYNLIDGWASNTSNFQPDALEQAYAKKLYDLTGKPTIIDTSRNGLGKVPSVIHNPPPNEWAPGKSFAWHPNDPAVFFNYYNKPSNESD